MGEIDKSTTQEDKRVDSGNERDAKGRFTKESAAKFGAMGGAAGKGSLSLVTILKQKLEEIPEGKKKTYAQLLIDRWLNDAIVKGDGNLLKEAVRYVDGMPMQRTDITTKGESLNLTDVLKEANNADNPEELQRLAKEQNNNEREMQD